MFFRDPSFQKVGGNQDPVGMVFKGPDGTYYRAVYRSSEEWLKKMLNYSIFQSLASENLIPPQTVLSIDDDPAYCAAIASKGGFWDLHVSAYPNHIFREAALNWIRINEFLLELDDHLGLIDGHYGNFALFEKNRPKWIDMGSIGQLKSKHQGIAQFIKYFVYPLLVFEHAPEKSSFLRRRIRSPRGGMTEEELATFISDTSQARVDPAAKRVDVLCQLRLLVESMRFSTGQTFWSSYRPPEFLAKALDENALRNFHDPRPGAVADLIHSIRPRDIIDVGGNDGLFSLISAKTGAAVLTIDRDDFSLKKLSDFVKERPQFDITVSTQDFKGVEQNAELVLALALTHHLVLAQKMDWDAVAEKLSSMSRRAVITEFMPDGLGGTRTHPAIKPNPLPAHYNLENCVAALSKHFSTVRVIDYGRVVQYSRRTLLLCTR